MKISGKDCVNVVTKAAVNVTIDLLFNVLYFFALGRHGGDFRENGNAFAFLSTV